MENNFTYLKKLNEMEDRVKEYSTYELDIEDFEELRDILKEIKELRKKILKIIIIKNG